MLNTMCKNCTRLGADCAGTEETVWTGCVFRKRKKEEKQVAIISEKNIKKPLDNLLRQS